MVGVELNSADLAKAAVKEMLERGYIINRTNEMVLRFLPPLIITTAHVDELCSALDEFFTAKESAANTAAQGA